MVKSARENFPVGGKVSRNGERAASKKSKPPAQQKRKPRVGKNVRRFWQPWCIDEYLNFSPYDVKEESVKKLQFKFKSSLSRRIDCLIKRLTLFPAIDQKQEKKILKQLIKMANKEIVEVSAVLKEIHKIEEKECCDVIANVAERDSVYRPVKTLLYPLLLEIGSSIPVWIGRINEQAPRLVGAIPAEDDSVIEPGQYVAAFVLTPSAADPDTDKIIIPPPYAEFGITGDWILARVLKKDYELHKNKKKPATKKRRRQQPSKPYLIVDTDNVVFPHYVVERKAIIPLPLYRADPKTNPEAIFPVGALVLALYSNATCFFPAVVLDIPKTLNDTYTLCFRDLSNKLNFGPILQVQQRYVIKYVEPLASIFTESERKAMLR